MNSKTDKLLKDFGKNLQRLRVEKGFTTRDFADEAEISASTLGRLESGQVNPTLTTLLKVADALGVDLNRLVGKR